jgi:hypothetical protein
MVVHLKIAALERNRNLLCQSWTKGHLVEWLKVNPPAVETTAQEVTTQPLSAPLEVPSPVISHAPVLVMVTPAKFRWNKNLEARLICAVCDDVAAFLTRGQRLNQAQLDARELNPFWVECAFKFNLVDYKPVNIFENVSELQSIDPSNPHSAQIMPLDLKSKFTQIRGFVTKATGDFKVSGGGVGYGTQVEAADVQDGGIVLSDYNWGADGGDAIISVTDKGNCIAALVPRVLNCLKAIKVLEKMSITETDSAVIRAATSMVQAASDSVDFDSDTVTLSMHELTQQVLAVNGSHEAVGVRTSLLYNLCI